MNSTQIEGAQPASLGRASCSARPSIRRSPVPAAAASVILGIAAAGTATGAGDKARFEGVGTPVAGAPSFVVSVSPTGELVRGYADLSPLGPFRLLPFLRLPDGRRIDFAEVESDLSVVNDDGSVAAASFEMEEGVWELHRWTEGTGWIALGRPPEVVDVLAHAMTPDGSVIVGEAWRKSGDLFESLGAFRWTAESGIALLDIPFVSWMHLSRDGGTLAGSLQVPGRVSPEAARWTEAGGLEDLGAGPGSYVQHVSPDGSIIVGFFDRAEFEAFRWTRESGVVALTGKGAPLLYPASSDDGSVVVGTMNDRAAAWTAMDGGFSLGILPGHVGGVARAASNTLPSTGPRIVGWARPNQDGLPTNAILWDRGGGLRLLKTALEEEYGLDLTGWTLTQANAISRDGTVIAGDGINPEGLEEGWVATLPTPPHSPSLTLKQIESRFALEILGPSGTTWQVQFSEDLRTWRTTAQITLDGDTTTVDPGPASRQSGYWRLTSP